MTAGDRLSAGSRESIRRKLTGMEPALFKQFVADLWRQRGWEVQEVNTTEEGIDMIAMAAGEPSQIIQAKAYRPTTHIRPSDLQKDALLCHQQKKIDEITVVTTGTFTERARQRAPAMGIQLVDTQELIELTWANLTEELAKSYFDDLNLLRTAEPPPAHVSDNSDGVISWLRSFFS